MMTATDLLYEQVWNHLKNNFETNKLLRKELDDLLHFYGKKLLNFAKQPKQRDFIENKLEDVVKSQYFQGYYIMRSLLKDEETALASQTWNLAKGIVRNEIPVFINNIFKDSEMDWSRTEIGHEFGIKLVQEIDGVFDIIRQMRRDIAYYGAYKAFIEDNRYKGNKEEDHSSMLLGNPFDLHFVSPQVFMQAQFFSNEHEVWDLYMWSSVQENAWVGSLHFSAIPQNNNSVYILELSISETIMENEKYEILEKCVQQIPESIRSMLQIRIYPVRELEVVVPVNTNVYN